MDFGWTTKGAWRPNSSARCRWLGLRNPGLPAAECPRGARLRDSGNIDGGVRDQIEVDRLRLVGAQSHLELQPVVDEIETALISGREARGSRCGPCCTDGRRRGSARASRARGVPASDSRRGGGPTTCRRRASWPATGCRVGAEGGAAIIHELPQSHLGVGAHRFFVAIAVILAAALDERVRARRLLPRVVYHNRKFDIQHQWGAVMPSRRKVCFAAGDRSCQG